MARVRIREFASSQPSQTVRSLPALSRRMKLVLEGFDGMKGTPMRRVRSGSPAASAPRKSPAATRG